MLLRCVPSVCPAAAAAAQKTAKQAKETPNCWLCGYINVHYSKLGNHEMGSWGDGPNRQNFIELALKI